MKEGRKEGNVLLTTHSTHFSYGYSDSERENQLPPHGLLFPISSKDSSHRQDNTYHGLCNTSRGALAGTRSDLVKVIREKTIRDSAMPELDESLLSLWKFLDDYVKYDDIFMKLKITTIIIIHLIIKYVIKQLLRSSIFLMFDFVCC